MSVSSPEPPLMVLLPVFPTSVLSRELPVALMLLEPVRVRFSMLEAAVKETEDWIRSVPSELFSVTVVDALEIT